MQSSSVLPWPPHYPRIGAHTLQAKLGSQLLQSSDKKKKKKRASKQCGKFKCKRSPPRRSRRKLRKAGSREESPQKEWQLGSQEEDKVHNLFFKR
jgi:hypothetical protein